MSFTVYFEEPGLNSLCRRPAVMEIALIRRLLPYVAEFGSPAFRRWILDMFPHKGAQKVKSIVDVMHQRSVEIYQSKKEALEQGDEAVTQQIGEGRDLMSILCEFYTASCTAA